MSRTMRDEAIQGDASTNMARRGPSSRNSVPRATLDEHCDHTNLNHDRSRCLGCGMWAHQFVTVPGGRTA